MRRDNIRIFYDKIFIVKSIIYLFKLSIFIESSLITIKYPNNLFLKVVSSKGTNLLITLSGDLSLYLMTITSQFSVIKFSARFIKSLSCVRIILLLECAFFKISLSFVPKKPSFLYQIHYILFLLMPKLKK